MHTHAHTKNMCTYTHKYKIRVIIMLMTTNDTGNKRRGNAMKPGFHAMPFLCLASWQGFYSSLDPKNQSPRVS